MASQEKITVHNIADLKNTSDDAIPNYLNSLKFRQDNSLLDTRLALGYGAFAVAATCFLWDYKLGFEDTKYYTAAAVALYSVLNGLLTFWIGSVEKGTVYQGVAADGSKISIATSTKKLVPTYHVKVTTTPKKGSPQTIELARSFTEWFDSQGHFIARPFQTMLATTVPLIAQADPMRAAAGAVARSEELVNAGSDVLDAILAADATGADAGGAGKKSKRRKA
ncbi:Uu.00g015990.m01.CDS01 [Anthostomella pinea]|uniref:Signal peptidase complex subunit 2 n=1 Tax=Anthostomella pinea TaxID=933095 RepID=A0AAI8VZ73_9PEZI|nr:Uu.00g015990.m01.CDS01 [Anthostomella pinea]